MQSKSEILDGILKKLNTFFYPRTFFRAPRTGTRWPKNRTVLRRIILSTVQQKQPLSLRRNFTFYSGKNCFDTTNTKYSYTTAVSYTLLSNPGVHSSGITGQTACNPAARWWVLYGTAPQVATALSKFCLTIWLLEAWENVVTKGLLSFDLKPRYRLIDMLCGSWVFIV